MSGIGYFQHAKEEDFGRLYRRASPGDCGAFRIGWACEELPGALRGVGMAGDITVIDQTPGRPWLVRIVHPTPTEDSAFHVEVPRAEREGQYFKLRFERVVGRQRQCLESWAVEAPRKARGLRAKQQDAGGIMDVDDDDDEEPDGGQGGDSDTKAGDAVMTPAPDAGALPGASAAEASAASKGQGGDTGSNNNQAATTSPAGGAAKRAKAHDKARSAAWYDVRECGGEGCCFYNCFAAAYAMEKDKMS